MKKLLFTLAIVAAMCGCQSPMMVSIMDGSGAVKQIEVRDEAGNVIEVSGGVQERVDGAADFLRTEIEAHLKACVAKEDFQATYEMDWAALSARSVEGKEPLKDEEKPVFICVCKMMTAEYVKQIVWPAWAKKILAEVMPSAKEKFAAGEYAAAREAIWSAKKCGVDGVDALVAGIGETYLGKNVNLAEWAALEANVTNVVSGLVAKEQFDEAQKFVDEVKGIRTYSTTLEAEPEQPSAASIDKEGQLGTVAFNKRLEALKERLTKEIAAARQAALDAKVQAMIDEFIRRVTEQVAANKFGEARNTIRDVEMPNDEAWSIRFYATRIGMLNSVVNPNQFVSLKAKIAADLGALIEKKQYAAAIAYVEKYVYVHDTFAQIDGALGQISKAMENLEIKKVPTDEYLTALKAKIAEALEKRAGKLDAKDAQHDLAELEKAIAALGKSYLQQYYDKAAADDMEKKVKDEIVAMLMGALPPMTTEEMNAALAKFMQDELARLGVEKLLAEQKEAEARALYCKLLAEMDKEVSFDAQIAMAEGAIANCEPAMVTALGDYARIFRCMKEGRKLEKGDANTLLVGSVWINQPAVFKRALELGADINACARRDAMQRPAILVAIGRSNFAFLPMIEKAGGKVGVVDAAKRSALHYAVANGNLAIVKALTAQIAVDILDGEGETPLFIAVRRNQLAVAKVLLAQCAADKRADFVEIKNAKGKTAFAVACQSNTHMLLDTLVAAGAKYDEADLAETVTSGSTGCAQWLVEHGLDVNDARVLAAQETEVSVPVLKYLKAEGMGAPVAPAK